MRNTVIWSFLGLVAVATGGLITGCDSDQKLSKSSLGESCDKTSDCNDNLRCIEGACYPTASNSSGGSASNEGGADNGTAGTLVAPKPPVVGGEGESCSKRADCEDGLGCFNQRCVKSAEGEGGEGNTPGVVLGDAGETCVTSADCAQGLNCVPGGFTTGGNLLPGVGSIGVCSVASAIVPSGKTCGAECREATDCCELPTQLHVAYTADTSYGTGAQSCSELKGLIGKANCKTATGAVAAQCFAMQTYCSCADDTWSCDAGACHYQAACTAGFDVPGGCPKFSRSGLDIAITCNTEGACAPEVPEVDPCKRDSDCDDAPVTNDPAQAGQLCTAGECGCHADSGLCYRKCDSDLDCNAGYDCDPDTSFCTLAPACTVNEECVLKTSNPNAACDEGVCKTRCNSTAECASNNIDALAETLQVCGPDHFCAPLGCSSDAQCSKAITETSALRMFCTEPPVVEGGGIQSAITD